MKRIFIIAGESSGDAVGAKLMLALKKIDSSLEFYGIGGNEMASQGLDSIFPMNELAIMGLVELIPHIPNIFSRINLTQKKISEIKPDIIITIDSPGFTFRVAKKIRVLKIKMVHIVAPSVWAWKPERAKKIAQLYDHLIAFLPFEPSYFEKEGLKTTFIGHPVTEESFKDISKEQFRTNRYIPSNVPLICVMPGSRKGEITKLLPIFKKSLTLLSRRFYNLHVAILTTPHLHNEILQEVKTWPLKCTIVTEKKERKEAMVASDIALAKSGTGTIELALAKIPMVIAYKVNAITAYFAKRMLKIKYVNLINIINNKEVIPEFLQEKCTPELISTELGKLLSNEKTRIRQIDTSSTTLKELGYGEKPSPSEKAANIIITMLSS